MLSITAQFRERFPLRSYLKFIIPASCLAVLPAWGGPLDDIGLPALQAALGPAMPDGRSDEPRLPAVQPEGSTAELGDGAHVVTDKENSSALGSYILHLPEALLLKGHIPYSKDFINDQDFRIEMARQHHGAQETNEVRADIRLGEVALVQSMT